MEALGIDIGGTGIKLARVETRDGSLLTARERIPTPSPSTPKRVGAAIAAKIDSLGWKNELVGCGFPGVVRNGVVLTAANVSKKWIETDASRLLESAARARQAAAVANDADLAGLAEMRFGAGRSQGRGVVLMLTFGTGIGTALFHNGALVPNFELGHVELGGKEAEKWASERVRVDKGLSFEAWTERVNVFLARMHAYFWPDLIIFGGGVSKKFDRFSRYLDVPCPIVPAELRNRAGVIGAAVLSAEQNAKG